MELFAVRFFLFIYSVATMLLSCITERMQCDSPELLLSLFLQPIEKLQLIYCRKVGDLLPTPPELDIPHNTIWVHILSFAPLWPVDQSNGLSEAARQTMEAWATEFNGSGQVLNYGTVSPERFLGCEGGRQFNIFMGSILQGCLIECASIGSIKSLWA